MKLSIKNFAKIKNADITIDGITVIAGENNTGKSTVGKILFSLFNSLSNVNEKILEERLKEIEKSNQLTTWNSIVGKKRVSSEQFQAVFLGQEKISRRLKQELLAAGSISDAKLEEVIEDAVIVALDLKQEEIYDWKDTIQELYNNTKEILNLPEKDLILEVVSRYFKSVFHSQIDSLFHDTGENTEVNLEIKGKTEELLFVNSNCERLKDDVKIIHKAIYIDNPFVVDELSRYRDSGNPMNDMLIGLLTEKERDNVMDGIVESVRAKEKLNDIYRTLQNVIEGEILFNQSNEEYYLKNKKFSEPISFHNLSTGMKSFVILKMLLERGCLKEKDVVILDEPEIHLHPQWQIAYAELIVLLQKQFDLSVVVTTHSPYFVDAINLFSCKYGTDSKVNYYLSSNNGKAVEMECVTSNIDLIYKKMASPIQMLDTLRYELNHNGE